MKQGIQLTHIWDNVYIDFTQNTFVCGRGGLSVNGVADNLDSENLFCLHFVLKSTIDGVRLYRFLGDAAETAGVIETSSIEHRGTIKEMKAIVEEKNGEFYVISKAPQLAEMISFVETKSNFNGIKEIASFEMIKDEAISMTDDETEFSGQGYYLPKDFTLAFELARAVVADGQGFLNIHVIGPSGYGKTSLFEHMANEFDKPIVHINCATVLDTEKWFGRMQAQNGNTFFEPTPLTDALRAGNCVILFDEISRIPPEIANSLFPILDHRRATTVSNTEIICGEGIVFGMTENVGHQYTGTMQLDVALSNRNIIKLVVKPLPENVERNLIQNEYPLLPYATVEFIVNVCAAIREIIEGEDDFTINLDVSTRTAKAMGELIQRALQSEIEVDMQTILDYTVFNHCDPRVAVTIIDKLKSARVLQS